MYCYLSCLSPDKHSELSHLIYCTIALLYLGTVRLVTILWRRTSARLSAVRQLKTPNPAYCTHITNALSCLVKGNCSIPVNKCLVIWYFYKRFNAEVTVSYPFMSSYQNRVKSTAALWLTSCGAHWFNRSAFNAKPLHACSINLGMTKGLSLSV